MRIGYASVSTDNQNLDLQRDALKQARVEKTYEDKASGKNFDRPQLGECLRSLRQGDTLVVWRLDRLGRSVKDLVALINELRDRDIDFVSLTEAIDTTTPMGSFIFHITAARARGRNGGRPKKLTDREWRAIRTLVDARELTIAEIAGQYGVSPATIYRRLPS
jgi:DNA invertase Pin-like site-specific DNA recombinase